MGDSYDSSTLAQEFQNRISSLGRRGPFQGRLFPFTGVPGRWTAPLARVEPGRERLAVHARQLAVQPRLQLLRRHRRPLLRGLEQTRRSAMENHVDRTPGMGR